MVKSYLFWEIMNCIFPRSRLLKHFALKVVRDSQIEIESQN